MSSFSRSLSSAGSTVTPPDDGSESSACSAEGGQRDDGIVSGARPALSLRSGHPTSQLRRLSAVSDGTDTTVSRSLRLTKRLENRSLPVLSSGLWSMKLLRIHRRRSFHDLV